MATLSKELRGSLRVSIWSFAFNEILRVYLLQSAPEASTKGVSELQEQRAVRGKLVYFLFN